MEPTLMVIGLNYRSAPVEIRERFWVSESGRYDAVLELAKAEGIEEIVVLATCNRTEFLLWANDADKAAGAVLRFLTAHFGLTLDDWKHFYRLLDDAALLHIFRVTCSLDSMVVGEPQIIAQVKNAWQQAQKLGSTAHFLDAVMQKALTVSKRVRNETAIGSSSVSIPSAAVELAKQVLGTLEGKKVLLLGAGKMSEISARYLVNSGATEIRVINRTYEHAVELAAKLGGQAVPFDDRWQSFVDADIVISSTSCPHTILSREEGEIISRMRGQRALVLVDIALPRDIDPRVRSVEGIFLYDLDDLEKVVQHNAGEREIAAGEAALIVAAEAKDFRRKLLAQRLVPTIIALRGRLDEICRQELESFRQECGPFPKDQEQLYAAVASRITQRIAGSLARELKGLPEQTEQEQMSAAVQRLFHLEPPQAAAAGTRH